MDFAEAIVKAKNALKEAESNERNNKRWRALCGIFSGLLPAFPEFGGISSGFVPAFPEFGGIFSGFVPAFPEFGGISSGFISGHLD